MSTIVLIEEEPLSTVLCKWGTWMAVMVVFVMALIYFSNYFAAERQCFTTTYKPRVKQTDTVIPVSL